MHVVNSYLFLSCVRVETSKAIADILTFISFLGAKCALSYICVFFAFCVKVTTSQFRSNFDEVRSINQLTSHFSLIGRKYCSVNVIELSNTQAKNISTQAKACCAVKWLLPVS